VLPSSPDCSLAGLASNVNVISRLPVNSPGWSVAKELCWHCIGCKDTALCAVFTDHHCPWTFSAGLEIGLILTSLFPLLKYIFFFYLFICLVVCLVCLGVTGTLATTPLRPAFFLYLLFFKCICLVLMSWVRWRLRRSIRHLLSCCYVSCLWSALDCTMCMLNALYK